MTNRTWVKDETSGGFKCEMPDNVTLFAVPENLASHSLTPKPRRGTKWRAGATHWCAKTSTASRFGRDVYMDMRDTSADARKLAMLVYEEATRGA